MDSRFIAVLPADQLPEGTLHECRIGGRDVVLCKTRDGVFALDNICTHAEANMSEGRLRGSRIVCPLHGAAFDVRDGKVLSGPAVVPLTTYAVRIENGQIEIEEPKKTP